VLIQIRYLALSGWEPDRIALALDFAECMAAQMASETDCTAEFEEQLRAIGERFPEFAGIWSDYEQGHV
jgi:hypothetical protein